MTYKGHVENGSIVLDEAGPLPDGASVSIQIVATEPSCGGDARASRVEQYRSFIGALDELPQDWSENHDPYLRERYGL